MATQTEAELEKNLIEQLKTNGYEFVNINDEHGLYLNFREQLEKLNKVELTDEEFKRVLIHLDQGTIFDRAEKLRDRFFIEREEDSFHIKFLNQKDWCKNIFQVSNQITFRDKRENRYDVTILINGLPLVQIELKRSGQNIRNAFNQIKRYKRDSYKGLFNYIQLFVISNGNYTKYFSNGNISDIKYEFSFKWKTKDNRNINKLDEFADTFLERCNLAKMISRYMVLNKGSRTLIVLRAYQKHAVEAILESKSKGYIWHSTGSGKTLTSFKASQLLANEKDIHKVVFVVDRLDLDDQTNKEFNKFCPKCVNKSESTKELIENLLDDNVNLVNTTIQKLANAVTKENDKEKLIPIKDKRMVFVYDECHRGHFGKNHTSIENFFENSLSYGFTGTPIFEDNSNKGMTTEHVFGSLLHSYLLKDAIADNNVLPFSVSYYEGDSKDYYNINRMNQIVDKIISSYDAKTRKREFNAMFTVPPKGFIHEYYKLFKEKEHDLKVATIFSLDDNEDFDDNKEHSRDLLDSYIADYNKMFGTQFNTSTFDAYRKDLTERMKKRKIDLLLVIDMFLTGFDNPRLNTLYVDKDLTYHKLLQAFSRTNRVFNERKSNGEIVSFRDISEKTKESIKLFSKEQETTGIILKEYSEYVEEFNNVLIDLYGIVSTVDDTYNLQSEDSRKSYVRTFGKLLDSKHMLETFVQFSFKDLDIEEQEFADFTGAYLQIYSEIKNSKDKNQDLSTENFRIAYIKTDIINVDYIIDLLDILNPNSPTFKKDKESLFKTMKNSPGLHDKIDLIEKFIDENLIHIDKDKISIREEFEIFMRDEEEAAIDNLVIKYDLDAELITNIIDEFKYSEKIDETDIYDAVDEDLSFDDAYDLAEKLKDIIEDLVEKFRY
ncbi:MAG: type I restriction endonuclease subunit R [archaeon]|nr:type I restriction endonuclease subunit R [archaeon]